MADDLTPLGKMQIINVRKTLAAGIEDNFAFKVPVAAKAELREMTYFLVPDSSSINVKSFEVLRWRASEKVNLLKDGDPNIKEVAGNGQLPRLMPVIEVLEDNEEVTLKIKNNEANTAINISVTLYFKIGDAPRDIAGQAEVVTRPA